MQVILIIFSILMFVVVITIPTMILVNIDDVKWYHYLFALLLIITLFVSFMCTTDKATEYNSPKAIDVYRNKTTLQITYVDSVPKDTTVVFK